MIFQAAGYDRMQEACAAIGHCDTGKAVITPGFNLKASYVIHAVGPKYADYARANQYSIAEINRIGFEHIIINEEITNAELYEAYLNSLLLAESHTIKSIAFPTLSAGLYGYPLALATHIEIQAITDYQKKYPNSCIEKVVICAFTDNAYEALKDAYNKIN